MVIFSEDRFPDITVVQRALAQHIADRYYIWFPNIVFESRARIRVGFERSPMDIYIYADHMVVNIYYERSRVFNFCDPSFLRQLDMVIQKHIPYSVSLVGNR